MQAAANSTAPIALLGLALALACGGCGPSLKAQDVPPKRTIVATDHGYLPDRLTVRAGTRITFVGRSDQPVTAETEGVGVLDLDRRQHREAGMFDVHTLQRGEAETVMLDRVGTYRYRSSYDGTMRGLITVTPGD